MNANYSHTGSDYENPGKGTAVPKGFPEKGFPFSIPDGYFELLPERIMNRITDNKPLEEHDYLQSFFRKPRYLVPVAALALMVILFLVFVPGKVGPSDGVFFPEISWSGALVSDPLILISTDEQSLYEIFLANGETGSNGVGAFVTDPSCYGVSEEAIMEYLSEDGNINEWLF